MKAIKTKICVSIVVQDSSGNKATVDLSRKGQARIIGTKRLAKRGMKRTFKLLQDFIK